MLIKVWWCRRSKMESWSWTIYCPMSCFKKKHAQVGGGRRSHVEVLLEKEGVIIYSY
jgi:hypothetical protein